MGHLQTQSVKVEILSFVQSCFTHLIKQWSVLNGDFNVHLLHCGQHLNQFNLTRLLRHAALVVKLPYKTKFSLILSLKKKKERKLTQKRRNLN